MQKTLQTPIQTPLTDNQGKLTRPWEDYFRDLTSVVVLLGTERSFQLNNNQAAAADVTGLKFSYKSVSQVTIDYLIQRVTTGGGAQELIETGQFYLAYKPTSDTWVLSGGPTTAGVTLSVSSAGQVQYTTSNITGTASISKITYRARSLAAKNSLYSEMGR